MNKVNISIVTYNNSKNEVTQACQSALSGNNEPYLNKLFIIDNSPETEFKYLTELSSKVVYKHTPDNPGFGASHNKAIKESLNDNISFHLVLNPDVYFEDSVIEKIINYMQDHPEVGLLMPKVSYPNGNNQELCKNLPTPIDLIARRFLPKFFQDKINKNYEIPYSKLDGPTEIPSLSGCFMFIRTSVLKNAGLFDENFFMYLEDIDLTRRIAEHAKTICHPEIQIYHHFQKGSYKNKKLLKYHIESAIYYFNKWGWLLDNKRVKKL